MSQLVRISMAAGADDGKSTLIGRLLYDTDTVSGDQHLAIERTSRARGSDYTDLALLTDDLRTEGDGIVTTDIAYRYFATPKRPFVIADTPSHVQCTRNMVIGASTADVVLILIDARNGVVEQPRRHAFLAALLGIRHVVVCVNKMDLVGWSRDRFKEIREEFSRFAMTLEVHDVSYIPVSALHGENVVNRGNAMPWYDGTSLLHHLEELQLSSDRNLIDVRLPVQYVSAGPASAVTPARSRPVSYGQATTWPCCPPGSAPLSGPCGALAERCWMRHCRSRPSS